MAASKPNVLGIINLPEAIPKPFDFAQGSDAFEAAALSD